MEQGTARFDDPGPLPIGTRIRRIRLKQDKTLTAVAHLAGITAAHLSRIETGKRRLDSRQLAHHVAAALGVPLSSLMEEPSAGSEAALVAGSLRVALAGVSPDDDPTGEPVPWDALAAETSTIAAMRHRSDYVGVSLMLPSTLAGLHSHTRGPRRRDALIGLTHCYRAAQATAHGVGARDLAVMAGHRVEAVTAHLDGPEWDGLAMWTRVVGMGSIAREQAHTTALAALRRLDEHLDDLRAAEVAGTLHLAAAHTSAVLGQAADAAAHLAEAEQLADRVGVGPLANLLYFTPWNVGAWATTIAVELGEGGRVMEIAQTLDDTGAPVPTRRAAWLIDLGRGAAMSAKTRPVAKRGRSWKPSRSRRSGCGRTHGRRKS